MTTTQTKIKICLYCESIDGFCDSCISNRYMKVNAYFVNCPNCGSTGPIAPTANKAVKLWNAASLNKQIVDLEFKNEQLEKDIEMIDGCKTTFFELTETNKKLCVERDELQKERDKYKAILDAQQERIDIMTGKRMSEE